MCQKWLDNKFPIKVRCRDFIANSTSVFLTNLGLPPSDKRKYMEKIQDKALTASTLIWQSHGMTKSDKVRWCREILLGRSGPVVMMLQALKPCPNPESSSDEGFGGSNAVVQTSVIV